MKLQEIMERTGLKETGLAKAWAKDALHLIRSQTPELIKVDRQNIIDGEQEYILPADLIQIKSISVKDTNDKKYKKIRRMAFPSVIREDTDPE
jgi:hypothetical protein|tara:strand:+ start:135 stop:413 length:279 start_codon:yes stop_codon:yes gene_type:complete